MTKTPMRPVRYMFVFGKGKTKARRESDNPTQYLLEQVTLSFAEDNFRSISSQLSKSIQSDVRAELVNVAAAFRHTIGLAGYHRGLTGTLRPKSIGGEDISMDLGSLPRWAPRDADYLADKKAFTGHKNWFDNTGWSGADNPSGLGGGTLKQFFAAKSESTGAGTTVYVGSGGIFEDIFGKITVEVRRNIKGKGTNAGTVKVGGGRHTQMQLASVRVRALGQLTDSMLRFSEQPNKALLGKIASHSAQGSIVALHLRGGRGRYRPTMEPYLKWFLQKALPHAVQQRLVKGTSKGRLTR